MISFDCGNCGTQLRVDDTAAGKKGKCPSCGSVLDVPTQTAEPEVVLEASPEPTSALTPPPQTVEQDAPIPSKGVPNDEPVWHYMVGQQKLGPLPTQSMLSMIEGAAIQASTMVWREGMPNWAPAGGVSDFAFSFSGSKSKKEAALGLTTAGLIIFIVLLLLCFPLCWIPWVIKDLKAK